MMSCDSGCPTSPEPGHGSGIGDCALCFRPKATRSNQERVARLCREEGLRVRGNARKRRRIGVPTAPDGRLRSSTPNQVWALDYQFDTTSDGHTLKLCNVTEEFTR